MIKKHFLFITIGFFCIVFYLATLLSGIRYPFGYGFWNAHGHDAVWHLAVSHQTLKSIPPPNPVFAGHKLSGYHWGYDLILQVVHQITHIPSVNLYFQVLPAIITILLALYSFKLKKNKTSAFFFVFLNFFAGSFGYLVTLYKSGQLGGESLFWSMQSVSTLINPPYALSLVILLSGLYYWQRNLSRLTTKKAILLGVYFGLNTNIKIYAAIITGLAFSFLYLYQKATKHKNSRHTLTICLSMASVSLLLLWLIGSTPSTLIFKPFWFIHSLIDSFDKLYIPTISSLRQNLSHQIFSYKLPVLIAIELFSFLLFLIGNLGTRFLSVFRIKQIMKSKKHRSIDVYFFFAALTALLIPTLFIQRGTAWNTIQFFYYFLIIANFYMADFLANLFRQKKYFYLSLVIVLTVPTSLSTLKSFVGFPPPANLPQSEIRALTFLKNQPSGIVLTYPYNHNQSESRQQQKTPIPLSDYQTTAYVSAFSGQITFLEDEMNLEITGYSWTDRLRQIEKFFHDDQPIQAVGMLLNNNIDYIYLNHPDQPINPRIEHQLKQIYHQDGLRIYKVLK